MSSGLAEEVRQSNWQFLIHRLENSEVHEAIVAKFRQASIDELARVLRYHSDPVTDPGEIEFRSRMDSWLGQASLIYLAWLCGYIPDPISTPEAGGILEILANKALRPYYEEYYPVAIPWLFRLHLQDSARIPSASSMDGAGGFERFSILYERFRDDPDLKLFLNLLDGFWYGRTSIDTVVSSFQNPDRVAEALAQPADRITVLDRGIVGMVRFLTFCHDLDQLLVLCDGMPRVQSAFWFFYAYWFHEYSVDVAEKSMEAIDRVMRAADSSGADSTADRKMWQQLLQRLTSGESAQKLVAEMEQVAAKGNADVAGWVHRFQPYTRPVTASALLFPNSVEDAPPPDAEQIVQCCRAIRRIYTVQMFSEKLAPAIHQHWRDHLPADQRGGIYDRPYDELSEEGQAPNLAAAMRIPEILRLIGCELALGAGTTEQEHAIADYLERNIEPLAQAEHGGWMEERLLAGWSYGPERDNNARKHPLLVPYAELPEIEKDKDRRTIRQYPSYVRLADLKIVRTPAMTSGS